MLGGTCKGDILPLFALQGNSSTGYNFNGAGYAGSLSSEGVRGRPDRGVAGSIGVGFPQAILVS